MPTAYMHIGIRTNGKKPQIIGADIMSEAHPTMLGHVCSTPVFEASGETHEEARALLLASLDNKTWRWLLELWKETGRK